MNTIIYYLKCILLIILINKSLSSQIEDSFSNYYVANENCTYEKNTKCPFKDYESIFKYYSKGVNYSKYTEEIDYNFIYCVNLNFRCPYLLKEYEDDDIIRESEENIIKKIIMKNKE